MPGPPHVFFNPAQWAGGFVHDDPRFQQYARRYLPAPFISLVRDDPRFVPNETFHSLPRNEDRDRRHARVAIPEPAEPHRLIFVGGVWVPEPLAQEDGIERERLAKEKHRREMAAIEAGWRAQRLRDEVRRQEEEEERRERHRARERRARRDEEAEIVRQAAIQRDRLAAMNHNQGASPVDYIANPWNIQVPPLKPPYIRYFPVDSQGNYIPDPQILQYERYVQYPWDEDVRNPSRRRRRRATATDDKKEGFLRKGNELQKKLAAAAERLTDAKKYQKLGFAGQGSDTVEQYERRLGVAKDDEARAKKAYEKAASDKRAWNEEKRRNGW